jgi:hypothetical protein
MDPVIQEAWQLRAQFQVWTRCTCLHRMTDSDPQVIDTAKDFLERITEIAQPNYIPSEQDIMRARVRTTGIVEETFQIGKHTFLFFDVGGQRNERKKWIACFSEVQAVIFVAALSEYNQRLFEDEHTNRMVSCPTVCVLGITSILAQVEAIVLFDEICNSRWFKNTSMILFLNKCDLFEQKIQTISVKSVPEFVDYSGMYASVFKAAVIVL